MTNDLASIATVSLAALSDVDATHVVFILDRSGSMHGKEADVIGGFNSYIADQRALAGAVGVSYVRFDNAVELVWNDVPLADVPQMTGEHYQPRGGTALIDAVGMTVSSILGNPDHSYVILIHTDGQENASREWTREKVKALVDARTSLGNWTFTFFGCDIDAWGEAGGMGFSAGNAMNYSRADLSATWKSSSEVTRRMRDAKLQSSRIYSRAVEAKMAGASDEDVDRILRDEDPPAP